MRQAKCSPRARANGSFRETSPRRPSNMESMGFKELPGCLGFLHTHTHTHTHTHNANETERTWVYTATQIFTRLRGNFLFAAVGRKRTIGLVRIDTRFRARLAGKRADKQRHNVAVYLRPVCKAIPGSEPCT